MRTLILTCAIKARPGRPAQWRPLFGQSDSAQGHLRRQGVRPGDIFLFFGWFTHTEERGEGHHRPTGPAFQAIWGWMEVGVVLPADAFLEQHPWAKGQHPHLIPELTNGYSSNTIYMAADQSALIPGISGSGVLRYNDKVRLTKQGCTPRVWSLPECFHPSNTARPLTYHTEASFTTPENGRTTLIAAARGQEFVVLISESIQDWLTGLLSTAETW